MAHSERNFILNEGVGSSSLLTGVNEHTYSDHYFLVEIKLFLQRTLTSIPWEYTQAES